MSSQPDSGAGVRELPPEDLGRIREGLRLFLICVLGLLLLMPQPLPWRLAGILLALAVIVVGVRLLRLLGRLRRLGFRPPGGLTVVTGLTLAVVLLVLLLADAAYYPVVSDLERCESGANTQTAQDACNRAAHDRLDDIVQRITRGATATP